MNQERAQERAFELLNLFYPACKVAEDRDRLVHYAPLLEAVERAASRGFEVYVAAGSDGAPVIRVRPLAAKPKD